MLHDLLIEPADLNVLLKKKEVVVIDCRFALQDTEWGRGEYLKAHVPGAFYAHLDEDLSSKVIPGSTGRHPLPHLDNLQNLIRSWGIDRDSHVVVYDQSAGGIAARAWWLLKWAGIDHVKMLNGGWTAWQEEQLPVSDEVPSVHLSEFRVQPGSMPVISMEEAGELSQSGDSVLIDARARERYLGEVEPIDPVAGHIPGARNVPWMSNTFSDGSWREASEVRKAFEAVRPQGHKKVAVYCGSGVTACHLAFAYEYAGLGRAAIYPGSWSEWITNDTNPVATGEE